MIIKLIKFKNPLVSEPEKQKETLAQSTSGKNKFDWQNQINPEDYKWKGRLNFQTASKSTSWFSVRNGIGRHIQLPYLHLPNKPNGVPDQSFATISPILWWRSGSGFPIPFGWLAFNIFQKQLNPFNLPSIMLFPICQIFGGISGKTVLSHRSTSTNSPCSAWASECSKRAALVGFPNR